MFKYILAAIALLGILAGCPREQKPTEVPEATMKAEPKEQEEKKSETPPAPVAETKEETNENR
jgi:predicted small lipoprotein YifL